MKSIVGSGLAGEPVGLFQPFVDDPDYPAGDKPKASEIDPQAKEVIEDAGPSSADPVQWVNGHDAVKFRNRLSQTG